MMRFVGCIRATIEKRSSTARRNKFILFFAIIFVLSLLIRFSGYLGSIVGLLFEPFLKGPRYFLYTVFDDIETIFTKNERVRHGPETFTWISSVDGLASKFYQLEVMLSQVVAVNRTLRVIDSKLVLNEVTSSVRLCDIFVFPNNVQCAALSPSVVVRKMNPRCTRPPLYILNGSNRTSFPFKVDQYGLRKGSTRLLAPASSLRFNETFCTLAHGLSFPLITKLSSTSIRNNYNQQQQKREERLPIIFQNKYQGFLSKAKSALGLPSNHTPSYHLTHHATTDYVEDASSNKIGPSSPRDATAASEGKRHNSSSSGSNKKSSKSKSRVWRGRRSLRSSSSSSSGSGVLPDSSVRSNNSSSSSSTVIMSNSSKAASSAAATTTTTGSNGGVPITTTTAQTMAAKSATATTGSSTKAGASYTATTASASGAAEIVTLTVVHWQKGVSQATATAVTAPGSGNSNRCGSATTATTATAAVVSSAGAAPSLKGPTMTIGTTVVPRTHSSSHDDCITTSAPSNVADFIAMVKNLTSTQSLRTSVTGTMENNLNSKNNSTGTTTSTKVRNVIYVATDIEDPKTLKALSLAGFKRYHDLKFPMKLDPLEVFVVELQLMIEADMFFGWGARDVAEFVQHARAQRAAIAIADARPQTLSH